MIGSPPPPTAMRFFNTAGPVNRADHYCLAPLDRLELDEILLLIQQKKYFVLHAPRQTGKPTTMIDLASELTMSERYVYG